MIAKLGTSLVKVATPKNYLKFAQTSGRYKSVTYVVNEDGVITLNGTAEGTSGSYNPVSLYVTLEPGNYTFTSLNENDTINTQQLYAVWQDGSGNTSGTGSLRRYGTTTFSLTDTTTLRVYLFYYAGNSYDNTKLYPMIIKGSYTYETIPAFIKSFGDSNNQFNSLGIKIKEV